MPEQVVICFGIGAVFLLAGALATAFAGPLASHSAELEARVRSPLPPVERIAGSGLGKDSTRALLRALGIAWIIGGGGCTGFGIYLWLSPMDL